jgi:transcriptional pleiotropic regulator of transition state genes
MLYMKSTGIVRKVDELGRIVLPIELRKNMDIDNKGDAVEIFIDDDRIILKKYQPACIFCGDADSVVSYQGKLLCRACVEKISNL